MRRTREEVAFQDARSIRILRGNPLCLTVALQDRDARFSFRGNERERGGYSLAVRMRRSNLKLARNPTLRTASQDETGEVSAAFSPALQDRRTGAGKVRIRDLLHARIARRKR